MKICKCLLIQIFGALCMTLYGSFLHFAYGPVKRTKKDPFNRVVFKINDGEYTLWPVLHFILYFFLGFMCPNHWAFILGMGVVWEIIEISLNYMNKDNFKRIHEEDIKRELGTGTNNIYDEYWWAGTWTDVVFNLLGFALGFFLNYCLNNGTSLPSPVDTIFKQYPGSSLSCKLKIKPEPKLQL